MPFLFNTLLEDAGLAPSQVRLLRHQTGKVRGRTPYSLWRDDRTGFERYQSYQLGGDRRAYFAAPYWASFVMPPGGGTMFVGLYSASLIGAVAPGSIDPLSGNPMDDRHEVYDVAYLSALAEYAGRLFVHWGDSSSANRAWVQKADHQNKRLIELRRAFEEEEFPGFTSLVRPLSEIDTMPAGWKQVLKANRGVYLLVCPKTREHYVGSAYGQEGFLGRWRNYVSDGHGGNVALRNRSPSDYVVSILEVAGSNATNEDIIALENAWKAKLLSRDMGLNRN
jgi:hypothetical protein